MSDNFKYKKSLGQNFLQDELVLQRIASIIPIKENDAIIEIGPGMGALTKYLVKYNCPIIAFEIDKEVIGYLDKLNRDNLIVINKDFLKASIKEYLPKEYNNLYIIANIPYYITTPIIEHIIKEKINEKEIVLLMQKEVADRLSSKPGNKEYGYFTVYLSYYYEINKVFDVNRNSFYPMPKVDSSVIHLVRKENINSINKEELFKFVKKCFQYKRKNLKNNLKEYNLDNINKVLYRYNHSILSRAEDLSLEEFIEIYKELFTK